MENGRGRGRAGFRHEGALPATAVQLLPGPFHKPRTKPTATPTGSVGERERQHAASTARPLPSLSLPLSPSLLLLLLPSIVTFKCFPPLLGPPGPGPAWALPVRVRCTPVGTASACAIAAQQVARSQAMTLVATRRTEGGGGEELEHIRESGQAGCADYNQLPQRDAAACGGATQQTTSSGLTSRHGASGHSTPCHTTLSDPHTHNTPPILIGRGAKYQQSSSPLKKIFLNFNKFELSTTLPIQALRFDPIR